MKKSHVLWFAAATMFPLPDAKAVTIVDLGTASSFAVLAGSQITDAGGSTVIAAGDVGLSPATGAFIGMTTAQVLNGTIYAVDAAGPAGATNNPGLLTNAKNDLTTAYNDAAGRTGTTFGTVYDLGGQSLFTGVYKATEAFFLTGMLELDAQNDPDAVWIFQTGTTLISASASTVVFKDGIGSACNVFWQVGSSATIGTGTSFIGNIMADQSIALQTGATLVGSAMARIGAVTLDHNTITQNDCFGGGGGGGGGGGSAVPDSGSTLPLLGCGLAVLFGLKRRLFTPAGK